MPIDRTIDAVILHYGNLVLANAEAKKKAKATDLDKYALLNGFRRYIAETMTPPACKESYNLLGMASVPYRGVNKRLIGYVYGYNELIQLPLMHQFPKDPLRAKAKLQDLRNMVERDLASHRRINASHVCHPKDYHEGCIRTLEGVIDFLNQDTPLFNVHSHPITETAT